MLGKGYRNKQYCRTVEHREAVTKLRLWWEQVGQAMVASAEDNSGGESEQEQQQQHQEQDQEMTGQQDLNFQDPRERTIADITQDHTFTLYCQVRLYCTPSHHKLFNVYPLHFLGLKVRG